jgi:hypothetical protein
MKLHALAIGGLLACAAPAHAIKIEIRYDYDTNGFFNQPGSKEALREVADYFESLIHDPLLSINPATDGGGTWTAKIEHPGTGSPTNTADFVVPDLVVPADTIIIYVGGRALPTSLGRGGFGSSSSFGSAAWNLRVSGRGQAGASGTTSLRTDFAPWGGHIAFDTATTWNFSTEFGEEGAFPFVSIAIHEMGHVLGIGTCPSWMNKILTEGPPENLKRFFTGPRSVAVFGGNVPLSGTGHWQDDDFCGPGDGYDPTNSENLNILSKAFGSFNTAHGYPQIAIMDPFLCNAGPFMKVFTDLDIAALSDIGWQVQPPLEWEAPQITPTSGPLAFSWPSTSGFTYRVQSTTNPSGAWNTLNTQTGNGSTQNHTAAAPAGTRVFYRLSTNPPAGAPLSLALMAAAAPEPDPEPSEIHEEGVTACDCHSSPSHDCP